MGTEGEKMQLFCIACLSTALNDLAQNVKTNEAWPKIQNK